MLRATKSDSSIHGIRMNSGCRDMNELVVSATEPEYCRTFPALLIM